MKIQEAVKIFESVRTKYDIPDDAELKFIEKRYIELPIDPETSTPIRNELVWFAHYGYGIKFFELTCNMKGEIVRFVKSR